MTDYKSIAFYFSEYLKEQTSDTTVIKILLKGGFTVDDIVAMGFEEDVVISVVVELHENELGEVEYLLESGFTKEQIMFLGYSEDLFKEVAA